MLFVPGSGMIHIFSRNEILLEISKFMKCPHDGITVIGGIICSDNNIRIVDVYFNTESNSCLFNCFGIDFWSVDMEDYSKECEEINLEEIISQLQQVA